MKTTTHRAGYILIAEGSTRHFFSSYIRHDGVEYVEDRNYAWFTQDRTVADQMATDLEVKTGQAFTVVPHSHEVWA